ncbi:MetQ/NlpA family ABC transporter substrate-binding protein [Gorillibacterium sp. sgz5001074]|uniref:MetQ/NlpA family ABC transporter substrate-binding protein n=1 Tax=Gorillibacterium sp. sgz5001074 TaxID=3446695 RepID=UPI003F67E9B6
MMKVIKRVALAISITLLILSLAACGSKDSDKSGSSETVNLKLGVVGGIYEELWAPAKNALKEQGINLEFVQFSDYVTPNKALNSGEIDLNAFQHRIYLDNEIKTNGYKIEKIGNTFIIPLNLYSSKVTSVKDLKVGDTIAIPNDVTNGGRALKVLEAAGLIKIKKSAGFSPTVADIESYTVGIKIKELAANTIPSALADVTAGIVNGNFALDFGLKTDKAIFTDTSLKEENYWNLIAARSEDVQNADKAAIYKKVVKAFQAAETEKIFKEKFGGFFIAVGWDKDLLAK